MSHLKASFEPNAHVSSLWHRHVLRHLHLLRSIARYVGLCTGQGDPVPRPLFQDQSPPD